MVYGEEERRYPRHWPRTRWDRDAFDELLGDFQMEENDVEYLAHLHAGRFEELDERGYDPFAYELWRVSEVLGMEMGELFVRTFGVE